MTNIDLKDFKDIVKAGVLIGQANPNKDVKTLVNTVTEMFIKELVND